MARERVRAAWDAASARRAIQLAANSLAGHAADAAAYGAPVGRLIIPALGLDEVVIEGVGGEELRAGPGHLPGSVLPGEAGNAVISAHRDRHFHALDQLAIGDSIQTITGQNNVTWVVVGRRVVASGEPALFAAGTPTLTLTTCWPVRYLGPTPDRLVVIAVQADTPAVIARTGE